MKPLDILIADDHPIFRLGLRQVIERDPNLHVVEEADNGETALRLIRTLRPDVAVLDIRMPAIDGLAVMQTIQREQVQTKTIILTMHNSEAMFRLAFEKGASGFLLKDSAVAEVISSIHAVVAGRYFISPELSGYAIARTIGGTALQTRGPLQQLTPTERRILQLIAEERTSREIASQLFISIRTVEHHRANICHKLGLSGFNVLVKFAIAHKSEC